MVGSYLASPGATGKRRLRFDVAVHDGVSGGLLERFKEEADESALLSSVESLGAHLRAALGGEDVTPAAAREMAAARPRSIEGLQAYTEGLSRLRVADAPGALRELEQAVTAEPDNALVHSALASAWLTLGFQSRALEEANRAMDLSAGSARTAALGDRGALPRSRRRARRGDRALSPRRRSRARRCRASARPGAGRGRGAQGPGSLRHDRTAARLAGTRPERSTDRRSRGAGGELVGGPGAAPRRRSTHDRAR